MADTYENLVLLLMHMDGANNSTTFADSSPFPFPIVTYGNVVISTAQSKFGGASGYFPGGSNDRLKASYPNTAYGTGDFTWEFWFYATSWPSNSYLLDHGSNGGAIQYYNGVLLYYNPTTGAGSALYTTGFGSSVSLNTWHHAAAVRINGTTTLYLDGVQGAQAADSHNYYGQQAITIGNYGGTGYGFTGYLDELRLTHGVGRYTTAFTPPAAAFDDPTPGFNVGRLAGGQNDLEDGGRYQITGTVTELGEAGAYVTRLYDRNSGRFLRQTVSAADGSYVFPNLAYRQNGYFAIAFDHGDNPLNAAIADLITPELMT